MINSDGKVADENLAGVKAQLDAATLALALRTAELTTLAVAVLEKQCKLSLAKDGKVVDSAAVSAARYLYDIAIEAPVAWNEARKLLGDDAGD